MRNKLLTVFGSVLMMAGVCFPVYASEEDVYEVGEIQSENQQLMNVDENGNVTARNKLIALANMEEITQKELLNKLIDKEIDQLNSKDKGIYAYILKAIEIKDEFRNKKER